MTAPTKHLVIVGDGTVGKTCLLYAFTNNGGFREEYEPTIYDKEQAEVELDGQKHLIKLHDTAGQEDYERIRQVIYKEASVFILCYSLDSRSSFENIVSKWYPELQPYSVPIVLVGTKSDLRGLTPVVQTHEGEQSQRALNANAFLECSAKEYRNINEVIHEAIRAADRGIPPVEEEEDGCMSFFTCCF